MSLEIVKVEEGLCDGKVLFHAFEEKTEAEATAADVRKDEARRAAEDKDSRRKQQVGFCDCVECPELRLERHAMCKFFLQVQML